MLHDRPQSTVGTPQETAPVARAAVRLPAGSAEVHALTFVRRPASAWSSQLLGSIAPVLERRGIQAPPSLLLDLGALYLGGPAAEFDVPAKLSGDPAASEWRQWLDEQRDDRAWRAVAHDLASLRPAMTHHRSAPQPAAGLETFLTLALTDFEAGAAWPLPSRAGEDLLPWTRRCLRGFSALDGRRPSLARSFASPQRRLLLELGLRYDLGPAAADLELLDLAASYWPQEWVEEHAAVVPRPPQTGELTQRLGRRTEGWEGYTTRGRLSDVVPSVWARPCPLIRVFVAKQALYRLRPTRLPTNRSALVVFTIDAGRAARDLPPTGPRPPVRYLTLARHLAFCVAEDLLRAWHRVCALELRLAFVLHDGGDRGGAVRREWVVVPDYLTAALSGGPSGGDGAGLARLVLPSSPELLARVVRYRSEPVPVTRERTLREAVLHRALDCVGSAQAESLMWQARYDVVAAIHLGPARQPAPDPRRIGLAALSEMAAVSAAVAVELEPARAAVHGLGPAPEPFDLDPELQCGALRVRLARAVAALAGRVG